MGEIGHSGDLIPYPFYRPIPWGVEQLFQPIWNQLGISYRPATVAEVFCDPNQLVCLHGQFWRNAQQNSIGVYNFIVHRCIAKSYPEKYLVDAVHAQLKAHVKYTESLESDRLQWLPPQMMALPHVSKALAEGAWALLGFGRNQMTVPGNSKGTLVPWQ